MFQGEGDELAGGSEDDGGVELLGRAFLRASDPHCTEVSGQGTVLFAAGEDIDFEAHMDGDLYDYVGGTAEAVEAEPATWWDIGEAESSVAYDTGAEEGGGLEVGEGVGDGECETLIRQDVIGVAAVHVVAVEESGLAEFSRPRWQKAQRPQVQCTHGTPTRAPISKPSTSGPSSSTVPTTW